ncbi:uncharacterized protein LOC133815369 [Humulus lupulus]|uniref:uncharacterized protein LOC133815369 n=1 Tax=Humulus lupulus TaxID=3486 RepID=UPI002B4061FE|nr:uncharacterized protein LOC133815369 [Humulus lupulus]
MAQENDVHCQSTSCCSSSEIEHWTKLEKGRIKVNVDAILFAHLDAYGIGWVVRSDEGACLAAFHHSWCGTVQPLLAKALGLKEVLSWIHKSCLIDIDIEFDSIVLVQAVIGSSQLYSPFGLIFQDCKDLLSLCKYVSLLTFKRSMNKTNHFLARSSYSNSGCVVRIVDIPDELQCILLANLAC